jgi:hypothetical protein
MGDEHLRVFLGDRRHGDHGHSGLPARLLGGPKMA